MKPSHLYQTLPCHHVEYILWIDTWRFECSSLVSQGRPSPNMPSVFGDERVAQPTTDLNLCSPLVEHSKRKSGTSRAESCTYINPESVPACGIREINLQSPVQPYPTLYSVFPSEVSTSTTPPASFLLLLDTSSSTSTAYKSGSSSLSLRN